MNDNLIHVKIEHSEAVEAKKDMLSSEVNLLQIVKAIKRYKVLRMEELEVKARLHKKLKEFETNLTKLELIMPKIKIPEIIQHRTEMQERADDMSKKIVEIKEKNYDSELESQLRDIQKQLQKLQSA